MAKNVEQFLPILDWREDSKIQGMNARLAELTRQEVEAKEALEAASIEVDKLSIDLDEARVSEMTGGEVKGAVDKLSVSLRNARLTRDAAHESHASLAHDLALVQRALGPLESQAQAKAKENLHQAHADAVQEALAAGEALRELLLRIEAVEDVYFNSLGQSFEPSARFARNERLASLLEIWADEASGRLSARWQGIFERMNSREDASRQGLRRIA